jgi:hypothetical protein
MVRAFIYCYHICIAIKLVKASLVVVSAITNHSASQQLEKNVGIYAHQVCRCRLR